MQGLWYVAANLRGDWQSADLPGRIRMTTSDEWKSSCHPSTPRSDHGPVRHRPTLTQKPSPIWLGSQNTRERPSAHGSASVKNWPRCIAISRQSSGHMLWPLGNLDLDSSWQTWRKSGGGCWSLKVHVVEPSMPGFGSESSPRADLSHKC